MTFRVITTPAADRHLAEIARWWRENRPAAPDLFLKEFAGASELIALAPHAGRLYRVARFPQVRRFLMKATRYHVYYVVRRDQAVVIAVWSAVRGTGPDLRL